ncbi:alpha/beta fold hydrolase, partial [Thermodesulfobacteriota bacterium]
MPRIQANGVTIHYQWDGPEQGPAVMLSHSLAADITMWDPQVGPLNTAGYRVLRFDTRGHGQSGVPDGPYTMALLADDAVGVMDALDLKSVHFCGLSMGGMIGQVLGARYAHRLRSLILCSTSAHMPPPEIWDERIALAEEKGLAALVDTAIDRWFTRPGQQRLPGAVEEIRSVYVNSPVKGFCACCAAIRDMDLRQTIIGITTPTLILV